MKKYINYSLAYAVAGMCCGVYYREFTKFNGFVGRTMLGKAHPHLLVLGMLLFLIIALFSENKALEEMKSFRVFMISYNIGLPLTSLMMVLRGTFEVLGLSLPKGLNASLSGVAGIAHVLMAVGLASLLLTLRKE